MFFFTRKYSLADSGIFTGFTDCHTHLLPGVDDGVRTPSTSLEILSRMERAGVKELWLTPHVMEDMPNTKAVLTARFNELKSVYQGNIRLHLAAEYMLDPFFEKCLQCGDLLLHDKNRLLVETSCVCPPFNMDALLEAIQKKGYTPLLAHPERYVYMDLKDYKRYKDRQILFQLNLPSLAGVYGPAVRRKAEIFLKKGYYDCLGTDTHSLEGWQYAMGEKRMDRKAVQRLLDVGGKGCGV